MARKRASSGGQRTKLDDEGNLETVSKYASVHDLRQAFGFRWSRRIMPPVLKELMRHAEIATTMNFYVGVNAQATAMSYGAPRVAN